MDAVELIVTALTAGAAAGMKDSATAAVKDAYASLTAAVRGRLSRSAARAESGSVVDAYAADPDGHRAALVAALTEAGVDNDQELVAAAQHMLRQMDCPHVQAGNVVGELRAKGVQVGTTTT